MLTDLDFLEADALTIFLSAYFKSNDPGLSATTSNPYFKWKSSLVIFTGLLDVLFAYMTFRLSYPYLVCNSTTHLLGEYFLEYQKRRQFCGIV